MNQRNIRFIREDYLLCPTLINHQRKISIDNQKVKSATVFGTNKRVNFTKTSNGLTVNFDTIPTEIDYIVELTL